MPVECSIDGDLEMCSTSVEVLETIGSNSSVVVLAEASPLSGYDDWPIKVVVF